MKTEYDIILPDNGRIITSYREHSTDDKLKKIPKVSNISMYHPEHKNVKDDEINQNNTTNTTNKSSTIGKKGKSVICCDKCGKAYSINNSGKPNKSYEKHIMICQK
tara:strand:- start:885 stop:1202 length:318 start_codon:yes stop_codon:yes gene_type:complete